MSVATRRSREDRSSGNDSDQWIPSLIRDGGPVAQRQFVRFFRNHPPGSNTRGTYAQAIKVFCEWAEAEGHSLESIGALQAKAYFRAFRKRRKTSTVRVHLSALRGLFGRFVEAGIFSRNPVAAVRCSSVRALRPPAIRIDRSEARDLLDGIDGTEISAVRDRALIGTMLLSCALVSAVVRLRVSDYRMHEGQKTLRLPGRSSALPDIPVHRHLERLLNDYIDSAGIGHDRDGPLFRPIRGRTGALGRSQMSRVDVLRMVKRRAAANRLSARLCCRSIRALGLSVYLENGGSWGNAQAIMDQDSLPSAGIKGIEPHLSRTEIERIAI